MPDRWIDFDAPWRLLLLGVLPLFWLIGRQSLQALGPVRRRAALALRVGVASLLILALAEPNWLTLVYRLTVLFVVDASDSIQRDELSHAVDYVNAAYGQRDKDRGDRSGLIVFGRTAGVEMPPVERPWSVTRIESAYDPDYTNLESALQLAGATFPADSAKRLVIVSDGAENVGRSEPVARRLLDQGVGIDCVPISYERQGEVAVRKIVAPSDVRRGRPFALRVVLESRNPTSVVPGTLRVTREHNGAEHLVAEEAVTLEPGTRVLTMRQQLAESGMATYKARFIPNDPADDTHAENNGATAFARVSGKGRVLVIEDASQPGQFTEFVGLLRDNDIDATVRDSRVPFAGRADLQQFDCVVLADVARVSGDATAELTQFSDRQVRELVQNAEHFGCGLVMLGGPNSYGAGGWAGTQLEEAMPVDFKIDSAKVELVGALVLVIDSSGSMTGEKIAWSKAAAIAAVKMLGARDYAGVVAFDSAARWIAPLERRGEGNRTLARIDRLGASGGTNMTPGLQEAYRAIDRARASLKHVIVLTDGQTPRQDYQSLVGDMRKSGVTTTGVAVGPDADRQLLAAIAMRGGGKFYSVQSPNLIPRIFMREARRVAMPLVFEDQNGIATRIVGANELLSGIAGQLPPVTGYVLTTVKEDPLVEVLISTPRQPRPNSTILATRQYGLGRTVALTTDAGQRWSSAWWAAGVNDKLLLQTVLWAMRSDDGADELALSAEVREGGIQVIVNALGQDDNHLNYLNLFGTLIRPSGELQDFSVEQIGPGRYAAHLPAHEQGDYYLSVSAAGRSAVLRTGVHVSSTAELDQLTSNEGLLARIAEGVPRGGEPGRLIQAPGGIADTKGLLATDVFRPGVPPAESREVTWPLLLLFASVVFLGDVFCRRVALSFDGLGSLAERVRARRSPQMTAAGEWIDRLRESKDRKIARLTAVDRTEDDRPTHDSDAAPPSAPAGAPPSEYTAKLLEAKRRLREQPRR